MTVVNSRLGQAPSSQVPDDCGVQTAPGDLGAVQRAVRRRRVHGESQYHRNFFRTILKTSFMESRITGGTKDTMP